MSGTKMVLRNCENKKYKRKTGEKAHKINRKWLVSAGKRHPDLSLNSNVPTQLKPTQSSDQKHTATHKAWVRLK